MGVGYHVQEDAMIRTGQIVAVTFDDHTQGGDTPLRFVV